MIFKTYKQSVKSALTNVILVQIKQIIAQYAQTSFSEILLIIAIVFPDTMKMGSRIIPAINAICNVENANFNLTIAQYVLILNTEIYPNNVYAKVGIFKINTGIFYAKNVHIFALIV